MTAFVAAECADCGGAVLSFLTTNCPLMSTILEKPSMFLGLVMIFLLSGEILLLIFFSAILCYLLVWYCSVPEILLCTRNTTVQEIQLSEKYICPRNTTVI